MLSLPSCSCETDCHSTRSMHVKTQVNNELQQHESLPEKMRWQVQVSLLSFQPQVKFNGIKFSFSGPAYVKNVHQCCSHSLQLVYVVLTQSIFTVGFHKDLFSAHFSEISRNKPKHFIVLSEQLCREMETDMLPCASAEHLYFMTLKEGL